MLVVQRLKGELAVARRDVRELKDALMRAAGRDEVQSLERGHTERSRAAAAEAGSLGSSACGSAYKQAFSRRPHTTKTGVKSQRTRTKQNGRGGSRTRSSRRARGRSGRSSRAWSGSGSERSFPWASCSGVRCSLGSGRRSQARRPVLLRSEQLHCNVFL